MFVELHLNVLAKFDVAMHLAHLADLVWTALHFKLLDHELL